LDATGDIDLEYIPRKALRKYRDTELHLRNKEIPLDNLGARVLSKTRQMLSIAAIHSAWIEHDVNKVGMLGIMSEGRKLLDLVVSTALNAWETSEERKETGRARHLIN